MASANGCAYVWARSRHPKSSGSALDMRSIGPGFNSRPGRPKSQGVSSFISFLSGAADLISLYNVYKVDLKKRTFHFIFLSQMIFHHGFQNKGISCYLRAIFDLANVWMFESWWVLQEELPKITATNIALRRNISSNGMLFSHCRLKMALKMFSIEKIVSTERNISINMCIYYCRNACGMGTLSHKVVSK